MAEVFQPTREDTYVISRRGDLFIRLDNGGTVRIGVTNDGVTILPINGVRESLVVVNGCAGIKFTAQGRERG